MQINNDYIIKLWNEFNNIFKKLSEAMGGTNNIVGEFAERLVSLYYNAKQAPASQSSFDIITTDERKIQVKSRRLEKLTSTQLNVIRSWDFDLLVIVIFSQYGEILKAIEINSEEAKKYAKYNDHQHGWIITTTKSFLNGDAAKDITSQLNNLLHNGNQ